MISKEQKKKHEEKGKRRKQYDKKIDKNNE
jgi:hypothetical protein